MEIDKLFGLPAHPLLVHVPVVLIPLGLLVAIVALWPWARDVAAPVAAGLAVVGAVGAVLAIGAGQELDHDVRETDRVEEHTEKGEQVELPAIAFGLVALAAAGTVEATRRGRLTGGMASAVVLAGAILAGAVATYTVTVAGHTGAEATWKEIPNERRADDDNSGPSANDDDNSGPG